MTLDHLLEMNQEKQIILERRHSQALAAVALRAHKWIAAKDSSLAKSLAGVTNSGLVIEELSLTYKRKLWSSDNNNKAINSILYPEDSSIESITSLMALAIGLGIFLGHLGNPLLKNNILLDNISSVLLILSSIYPITFIVRWLIKMLITKFNLDLAWYAPISFFFKIEEKYIKERNLLLIEEENIKMALQQEKAQQELEEQERTRIEKDFDERLGKKQETG